MKLFSYSLIFFFIIITTPLLAQKISNEHIANAYLSKSFYYSAIKYYKAALRKEHKLELYPKLMHCLYRTNQPLINIKIFEKLDTNTILKSVYNTELYYLKSLLLTENYGKAKKYIEQKKLQNNYKEIYESCDFSIKHKTEHSDYQVINASVINTEFSEISPFPYNSRLIYASNGEEVFIKNRPSDEEYPFYDLYEAKLDTTNLKIGRKSTFSSKINTSSHESSASFSNDGNKIYFTQHTSTNDKKSSMNIFYMEKSKNGIWSHLHDFIFNDSTYSSAHPFLSDDNKLFFFSSNKPGGIGGSDIYFCLYDSINGWSDPTNMGEPINTKGNEIYPYFETKNQILYFSSDNHIGYGGFDIFKADISNTNFIVENLKKPINSSYDDFGLMWSKKTKIGFMVSNRKGGLGKEDIYLVKKIK